MYHKGRGRLIW